MSEPKPQPPVPTADPAESDELAQLKARESIAEIESILPQVSAVEEKTAPSSNGGNLAALRDRVLHSSALPTPTSKDLPHDSVLVPPQMSDAPVSQKGVTPTDTLPTTSDSVVVADSYEKPAAFVPTPIEKLDTPPVSAPVEEVPAIPATAITPPIAAAPQTPITPKRPFAGGAVRPLRTFRDDVAEVVERRQISVVSAITAEEERRSAERGAAIEARSASESNCLSPGAYFMLGMSTVFLIVGGLAFATYWTFFKSTGEEPVVVENLPTIIFAELSATLPITGMDRVALMDALAGEKDRANVRLGAITAIHLIDGNRVATAPAFFTMLETRAPAALLRSLLSEFMFGIHEFDGNEPFLILKTNSYETAFAGMYEWEGLLSADLSPLFGRASLIRTLEPIEEPVPVETMPFVPATTTGSSTATSTDTATSSASTTEPFIAPLPIAPSAPLLTTDAYTSGRFQDVVIRNKEARVLKNSDGLIILLYAFLDPNTIVITTNEYTFIEVLTRYASQR